MNEAEITIKIEEEMVYSADSKDFSFITEENQ